VCITIAGSIALGQCRSGSKPEDRPGASAPPPPPPEASAPPAAAAPSKPRAVPQRKLGKTGVEVSMIGLGGFHVAKGPTEAESIALIRRAIDSGITFMDNCWDYNDGASEERMGKALQDGYRARVFLMTKLDGRTKSSALAQLEQSLKRLRTDTIDLVQIHEVIHASDPERCFRTDGIAAALRDAKQAGKLRYVGFTGHKDPDLHLAMLEAGRKAGFEFDAVQLPLNVMDPHFKSFELKVLPVLQEQGIGVLGMKALGSGDLLKSGVVSAEECLRYALSLPTSVVITGIDKQEVLDQALRVAHDYEPLTLDERRALLARTKPHALEGQHELFKTADKYDGTVRNPHWLREARL
jgi:aryl-alcohol dehydrogenase-like predicted oxidoreductase